MSFNRLYNETISKLLCSQCGACVAVCPAKAIKMAEDELGYVPELVGNCLGEKCSMCSDACPGAYIPMGELEEAFLGRKRKKGTVEDYTGAFRKCLIGWVPDPELKNIGASGTIATAALLYALDSGIIDAAVVADFDSKQPWKGMPTVASSREEIIKCASTKYDPLPIIMGLKEAADKGYKKIAVVGCPCIISSIRKMQMNKKYKKLVGNVVFTIGLFCFSCFTRRGTEYLITERLGVSLDDVADFKYRDRPWPGYFRVFTKNGERIGEHWISFHMAGRMMSSFKPEACLTCLDATAELADLSMGDGWGHEASDKTAKETGNIPTCTIIRTEIGEKVFAEAEKAGYIYTIEVPREECSFIRKNGALIHKLEGHAPRVRQRIKYGLPVRNYGD